MNATADEGARQSAPEKAIRKIVIGVGPVGEAFEPPLEWNGVG